MNGLKRGGSISNAVKIDTSLYQGIPDFSASSSTYQIGEKKKNQESISEFNIQSELTSEILNRFYEIEQDSIAYFFNECKVCDGCGNIFSKKDIYGIDPTYVLKTVAELECEYDQPDMRSNCCNASLSKYRGEEKKQDIQTRLTDTTGAHCVVYRGKVGEILGCMYGYVENLEIIYNKEFKFHFQTSLLDYPELLEYIENGVKCLTICGMYTFEKNSNPTIILRMLQEFFNTLDNKYLGLPGIVEAQKGTPTHKLFKRKGAHELDLEPKEKYYVDQKFNSFSILFQENVIESYRNSFKSRAEKQLHSLGQSS